MGAYVTSYPNVCLGVCGQWHHPITDAPPERPDYQGEEVAVDLGFILSNDGVHFREPAPGFTFIGRDQELSWDRDWRDNTTRDRMLLEQGPLLNIGDRTVLYYTACTPHGNLMGSMSNIGMATLPRERFGSLTPVDGAAYGQAVTDTIQAGSAAQLCANVETAAGRPAGSRAHRSGRAGRAARLRARRQSGADRIRTRAAPHLARPAGAARRRLSHPGTPHRGVSALRPLRGGIASPFQPLRDPHLDDRLTRHPESPCVLVQRRDHPHRIVHVHTLHALPYARASWHPTLPDTVRCPRRH